MSDWIPVIAALLGTLIGSLISYLATVTTNRRSEASERRAIMLSKLEETHQVIREIRQQYTSTFGMLIHAIYTGELLHEEQTPLEIDRLNMLSSFYFPELNPMIDKFNIEREEFGWLITEVITLKINRKRSNDEILIDLEDKIKKLKFTSGELLNAVSVIAKKKIKM